MCYCNDRTMYFYLYGPQWWGCVFHMLWSTIGGSRLPSDLVLLWVIHAGLVASPAVTRKRYSVCLVFLNGADLLCDCHKVWLCKSSGEYSEADIT